MDGAELVEKQLDRVDAVTNAATCFIFCCQAHDRDPEAVMATVALLDEIAEEEQAKLERLRREHGLG
jgi:hypothetical protein